MSQATLIAEYSDGTEQSRALILDDRERAEQLAESLFSLFPNSCVEHSVLVQVLCMIHNILRGAVTAAPVV